MRAPFLVGAALLLGACFDPDKTPLETESAGAPETDTTAGTACEPGEEQACTCEDGSAGTQACSADGSGFGACACEAADSTSTTSEPPPTTDDTTGPPPECVDASDCSQAEGDCQADACVDGVCMVEPANQGMECGGPAPTECSAASTCRGTECVANVMPDGSPCTDCETDVCSCVAGECDPCDTFAPENNFITARSIAGWTLSGGWALYREAPQTFANGPTVFAGQVLGTDGNRLAPYPGAELESSAARSGPTVLPATLDFLSWNVDEGGSSYDTKQVRVSNDGGASFVTLVDCTTDPQGQPFCNVREETRAADDWDPISLPVPADMVGDVGIVELTYNTGDSCCNFERGWFIDVTNFATECACAGDEGCADLGGECGAGVCGASGECELDVVAAGTACGDAADAECNASDACDGLGYCATNVATNGLTSCESCPAGAGSCNACQDGECIDCVSLAPINDFAAGTLSFAGWVIEDLNGSGADWQLYDFAPQSQVAGSVPTALSFAPSFGIDGNRQVPYPGLEAEHSRITTTPDTVPPQLTFSSWNVDEGVTDYKIIEVSIDGGASWNALVDCTSGLGGPQPFCQFRQDPRAGNEWDDVVIDTGAFAGQVGQLRFTYNTQDACCNFERGWFIDNLNFARYCGDAMFP